jgi:NAD(P)H-hydrate epimerase
MRVVDSSTMRKIDQYCIETLKIKGIILMENAALKVFSEVENKLKKTNGKFVTILCGVGNNGGDGLAVARHLYLKGYDVKVFIVGDIDKASKDFQDNFYILKNINQIDKDSVYLEVLSENNLNNLKEALIQCDIVLDGIFGTGLKRNIEGIHLSAISLINESSKYIISIDVPSGLNSDNGKVLTEAVKANETITLQLYKKGFLNYEAFNYCGEIKVVDIGIPKKVIEMLAEEVFITSKEWVASRIPLRSKISHKGNFGKVLIVAGSNEYTGAAYFSAQAAVKSGAGLISLSTGKDVRKILQSKLAEVMVSQYEDKIKLKKLIDNSDVIAIGPGLGNEKNTFSLVQEVLLREKIPVVIDADGINALKDNLEVLLKRQGVTIITPHLGEMSRIVNKPISEIEENRMEIAKEFAIKYNTIVLLKGYNTIITDGKKVMINPTGNSAMASGGMGDVLTGLITSFIGQGIEPFEATVCAAFIHGAGGDKLAKEKYSVTASDILESLPYTIKELLNCKER